MLYGAIGKQAEKNREGKENLEENYFWSKGVLCKGNTVAVEVTGTLAFNSFIYSSSLR